MSDGYWLFVAGWFGGMVAGFVVAAREWADWHRAQMRQARADHRRQMTALFGQREAAAGSARCWSVATDDGVIVVPVRDMTGNN